MEFDWTILEEDEEEDEESKVRTKIGFKQVEIFEKNLYFSIYFQIKGSHFFCLRTLYRWKFRTVFVYRKKSSEQYSWKLTEKNNKKFKKESSLCWI